MGAICGNEISAEHAPQLAFHYLWWGQVAVVLRKPSVSESICRFNKHLCGQFRIVRMAVESGCH